MQYYKMGSAKSRTNKQLEPLFRELIEWTCGLLCECLFSLSPIIVTVSDLNCILMLLYILTGPHCTHTAQTAVTAFSLSRPPPHAAAAVVKGGKVTKRIHGFGGGTETKHRRHRRRRGVHSLGNDFTAHSDKI